MCVCVLAPGAYPSVPTRICGKASALVIVLAPVQGRALQCVFEMRPSSNSSWFHPRARTVVVVGPTWGRAHAYLWRDCRVQEGCPRPLFAALVQWLFSLTHAGPVPVARVEDPREEEDPEDEKGHPQQQPVDRLQRPERLGDALPEGALRLGKEEDVEEDVGRLANAV